MPGPGYAWVDGYWNWGGDRYVWVPGVWRRPPYAGGYWTHPHYDHYDRFGNTMRVIGTTMITVTTTTGITTKVMANPRSQKTETWG